MKNVTGLGPTGKKRRGSCTGGTNAKAYQEWKRGKVLPQIQEHAWDFKKGHPGKKDRGEGGFFTTKSIILRRSSLGGGGKNLVSAKKFFTEKKKIDEETCKRAGRGGG